MNGNRLASCLIVIGMFALGCVHQTRTNRTTASAWLQTKQLGTARDVSGVWQGPAAGFGLYGLMAFGRIVLVQQGSQLTGNWSEYEMLGISGKEDVYLVALEHGNVRSTFHLKLTPKKDALIGLNCNGFEPEGKGNCSNISLTR